MDDLEELRRKRAIKVVLTDIFMALSVVAIVCILVAVVAGWRINSDFSIQQNGLAAIKTSPAGAKIIIDGDEQSLQTNARIMLPGGEHKIEIEKDGYERWEKTVKITPGWLLRLEYPRLFKQNREKKVIKDYETLKFFYASPDHNSALLSTNDTTEWYLITDLANEKPKFKKLNIKGIFSGTEEGEFTHKIKKLEWSKNNEKLLIGISETNEWAILDLRDIKNSINLTENYSRYEANAEIVLAASTKTKKTLTDAKFENESGEKVIVTVSGNLVSLDTVSKTASKPIAEDVVKFEIYGTSIIYSTRFEEGRSFIKLIRLGDKNPTIVAVNTDKNAILSFNLTKQNSTSYLLYTIGNRLHVFKATDFPTGGGNKLNMKKIIDEETGVIPSEAITSYNSEFIVLREGSRVIIFDSELELWHEYDYGDEEIRFLDDYMFYRVDKASGKFLTWDFDSTNVRVLVVDKAVNDFNALISSNNKYFYYIAKAEEGYSLIQEKL